MVSNVTYHYQEVFNIYSLLAEYQTLCRLFILNHSIMSCKVTVRFNVTAFVLWMKKIKLREFK